MTNDNDYKNLLAECEQLQIHTPGAIQPFGILLTVEPNGMLIQNVSENCETYWGISAKELIGMSFNQLMLAHDMSSLATYLVQPNLTEQTSFFIDLPSDHGQTRTHWELSAHSHCGVLFLELEPTPKSDDQAEADTFSRKIRNVVQALQQADSLQSLCDGAVREVKKMTGFSRVMLYRFDPDWHGKVIAEACAGNIASYLGHHFPASDIPAQARAIFLQNWLRMIPDVSYQPCQIYPGKHPVTQLPLDLGKATLRSVSPIHLEYLRNMDVQASLTISLIDEGKLWGLIACHHDEPILVDTEDRIGAQLIGRIVSSQIRVKESLQDLDYKAELKRTQTTLLSFMQQEDDMVQGMVRHSPTILDMAAVHGAAIGIAADGGWTLLGNTPSVEQIEDLVTWLSEVHGDESLFHTDSLSRCFPPAAEYKSIASGLLAITIPKTKRNYVLWFRAEAVTSIVWAGSPEKSFTRTPGQLRLHPRESFESWKELVTGQALPLKKVEINAVEDFRNGIIALDLERQFKKEQAARAVAEQLSREKEEMVMMVSHDLRTPLSVLQMNFEMLEQLNVNMEPALKSLVERGGRAMTIMEKLITDILDIGKREARANNLQLSNEDAWLLITDIIDLSLPLAKVKGIELKAAQQLSQCLVQCERNRIFQVLSNLVSNAIKFTPPGGSVTLSAKQAGHEIIFRVSDTGQGIPPENLEKLFDRFWQAKQSSALGIGIGLSIARDIVKKHSGKIWVESELGVGTTFRFSLPKAVTEIY